MVHLSVDCWTVGIMEELINCIYGVSECGLLEGWHHGACYRLGCIYSVSECGLLEFWPHGGVDKLYIWCV